MKREIPLYTLDGVRDADVSTHPFTTEDGLGLSLLRFLRAESQDVVLLIPGLTQSSDMFIMPEHRNLVSYLLDNGFGDVWSLDGRMSNRHPYNHTMHRYTFDDVAHWDNVHAVETIRRAIGPDRRLHVISHCMGALTFLMSLTAGVVEGVSSVVANSVALTPNLPRYSAVKLAVAPELFEYAAGFEYIDPRWGEAPRFTRGWLFAKLISAVHHECDESACHILSHAWGSGWPALYRHENLLEVTHRRLGDLCGATGAHYWRHVRKMYMAGRAVKYDPKDERHEELPNDYLSNAVNLDMPILLTTGDTNNCFGDSNEVCYRKLEKMTPGRHEFRILPGYGHLDPFIGENAAMDVFPHLLDFLKRQAG
ncbi:cholesterol oxidase [Crossiella equi]|uniref:Cholesterol oxidase n=1 Tax=Crossiella equi TaxID=130796 RepID=A0ABS5AAK8_9PSEU|nr:alpha/beta fold hydrolase [Crossiella equi]MBP2473618.1 cholesterol oxidase [Crossiella equi]